MCRNVSAEVTGHEYCSNQWDVPANLGWVIEMGLGLGSDIEFLMIVQYGTAV